MMMRSVLIALGMLTVTACTSNVATRGHYVDAEQIALIKTGVTTRDDVIGLLGSPSVTGTFDDKHWYYIGQRTEQKAFFAEKIVDRQILALTFGEDGTVADISHKTLADGQDVALVTDVTPTAGREMGVFQQLLGNVGRFSGADKKGQGAGN